MKIVHFVSYSYDNYYMLVEDDFKTGTGEDFCKKYIDYEYEAWYGEPFKYKSMVMRPVLENGLCIILRSFDEIDVINTNKMKMYECLFSDSTPYIIKEDRYPFHTCDTKRLKELTKKEVKNKKYIK